MAHRKYELRKRADRQEETRLRIVAAAMELHGTVGPLATTVSAVAQRAGVERLTVYRHFPTTEDLFNSCGALFMETYPLPRLIPEDQPAAGPDRLRATLQALYPYYEDLRDYLEVFLRDVEHIPHIRAMVDHFIFSEMRRAHDWILAGFEDADTSTLSAVVGQAIDFWGWRSWRQQSLSNGQVIDLAASTATQLAARPHPAAVT
ncbi:MAG: TetR/AcrR family transcriptional regulator [Tepidiformaceae bacterium]